MKLRQSSLKYYAVIMAGLAIGCGAAEFDIGELTESSGVEIVVAQARLLGSMPNIEIDPDGDILDVYVWTRGEGETSVLDVSLSPQKDGDEPPPLLESNFVDSASATGDWKLQQFVFSVVPPRPSRFRLNVAVADSVEPPLSFSVSAKDLRFDSRLDYVVDRVSKRLRSRNIPLMGGLLDLLLSDIPIMYLGEIVVPGGSLRPLLDQLESASSDEMRKILETFAEIDETPVPAPPTDRP